MSEKIKLCVECARFIHVNAQCSIARMAPDYVFGKPAKTRDAQVERENTFNGGCGPTGRNFVPIVPAHADTRAEWEKDQSGRYDMSATGNRLVPGS